MIKYVLIDVAGIAIACCVAGFGLSGVTDTEQMINNT